MYTILQYIMPERPKEGIGFPRTLITGGCELLDVVLGMEL